MGPSGLQYVPSFIDGGGALYAELEQAVPWTGQMKARDTASMGVPYNYAGASYPIAEWHPLVARIRDRVGTHLGFEPNNCLINHYPTGEHTIGWHADDVDILAPDTPIAIVSTGAPRPMRLRTGGPGEFTYVEQLLEPGSLLVMSARMQAQWKHTLKRAPGAGGRISLTFRHIVHIRQAEQRPRWGQ